MPDLPGELEDSEEGVERAWSEIRGGPSARENPRETVDESAALPQDQSDHWLGRIAIYYLAHPTIPDLYQCCFDYAEPWDWSRQTERVATGRWIYRRNQDGGGRGD